MLIRFVNQNDESFQPVFRKPNLWRAIDSSGYNETVDNNIDLKLFPVNNSLEF